MSIHPRDFHFLSGEAFRFVTASFGKENDNFERGRICRQYSVYRNHLESSYNIKVTRLRILNLDCGFGLAEPHFALFYSGSCLNRNRKGPTFFFFLMTLLFIYMLCDIQTLHCDNVQPVTRK